MKYSIKVNEVRAKEGSNIKGFATVVFGDSFKITNIAILENKDKGELFVSMPRYRSNERDESNGVIYKDVCNPITAEFREELYTNILDAYARIKEPEKEAHEGPPRQRQVRVENLLHQSHRLLDRRIPIDKHLTGRHEHAAEHGAGEHPCVSHEIIRLLKRQRGRGQARRQGTRRQRPRRCRAMIPRLRAALR